MERFFRSLKTEWIPKVGYPSFEDEKKGITDYIIGYYSQFRLHIPAHHEHPFWFNVNTCSGRT